MPPYRFLHLLPQPHRPLTHPHAHSTHEAMLTTSFTPACQIDARIAFCCNCIPEEQRERPEVRDDAGGRGSPSA